MPFVSFNPATEELLASFEEISEAEQAERLDKAELAFCDWKKKSFKERAELFWRLAEILKNQSRTLGELMTKEMGKPIMAAMAEVEKCALACEYYAKNTEFFLAPEVILSDARESYVVYDPLGIILAVMPWNFPFWQVVRAAAPILMAGNVMILKHASNVPQCALALEKVFLEAGIPAGVFQNFLIGSKRVAGLIADERVKAATLTGSEYAGSQVASECGQLIKKTVLELGGSDPFIVLEDADIDKAAAIGVDSRFINTGQSCIAAKRFIVVESKYQEFVEKYLAALNKKIFGDPMNETTQIGPVATAEMLSDIEKQVVQSVQAGAKIMCGGKKREGKGFFYEPTVLTDVKPGMAVYDQETFGPAAAMIQVKDLEEAIKVANDSEFGLGASLWTKDLIKAKELARQIESGSVFINGMVKSDPRLPFGGIKKSGYGRELAHHALKEFVNVKTVWLSNDQ